MNHWASLCFSCSSTVLARRLTATMAAGERRHASAIAPRRCSSPRGCPGSFPASLLSFSFELACTTSRAERAELVAPAVPRRPAANPSRPSSLASPRTSAAPSRARLSHFPVGIEATTADHREPTAGVRPLADEPPPPLLEPIEGSYELPCSLLILSDRLPGRIRRTPSPQRCRAAKAVPPPPRTRCGAAPVRARPRRREP